MGNVYIDPNLRKTSERIDPNGNVINPRTKEVIQPVIEEYVEPTEVITEAPKTSPQPLQAPITSSLSIQEQIDQAKQNLAKLEELKKLKIAQMKAEIELLEQ
jgi:hypothetical protein